MGLIKWVVFSLGGLAFLITVIFSVMLFLNPPVPKDKEKAAGASKETVDYLKKKKGKLSKIEALTVKVAELEEALVLKNTEIDSLSQIALEKELVSKELAKLNAQMEATTSRSSRAKDIAKTLSAMKSKSMSPILNKLDDSTVILIYNQTSKTARKGILLALSDDRAARITKKLIN